MLGREEGNVLFNDALNTFYLRLYGVTPVVEHWLEREIAQWVHPMKDRSDDPSQHDRTLLPRSYFSLLRCVRRGDCPSYRKKMFLNSL